MLEYVFPVNVVKGGKQIDGRNYRPIFQENVFRWRGLDLAVVLSSPLAAVLTGWIGVVGPALLSWDLLPRPASSVIHPGLKSIFGFSLNICIN